MNLYEINSQILDCIDQETGEVMDIDRLEELNMAKAEKVDNIACWVKNLEADVVAFEAQEKAFADRKAAAKRKIYGSATKITQNLSGMPTASGNGDKIGNAAVDIIEEQTRYREMVKRLTALQNEATKRAYCLVVATECANAIVDFYVNGKTQDQIADETGVSGVDIVRKRINRGCKALAEIWLDFSTV